MHSCGASICCRSASAVLSYFWPAEFYKITYVSSREKSRLFMCSCVTLSDEKSVVLSYPSVLTLPVNT